MSESSNPYAPTLAEPETLTADGDAVAIRRQYLSHEASVKSIGTLYILGAFFLVPAGVIVLGNSLFSMQQGATSGDSSSFMLLLGLGQLGLGLFQVFTGLALRQLKAWSRTVAIMLSTIGLIGFPIGTLVSIYFLFLLVSAKGAYVFSEDYQRVIAATPEIKYRTSTIVWVLLVLLLCLLGLGIGAALLGSSIP